MGKFLYTIVCRYYTVNGIIELDLYEVFKRLRMKPTWHENYGYVWPYYEVIHHHVYSGQAVEYVIKKVLRDIEIDEDSRKFYSYYPPYSIMYDCRYDLKDVERMNYESIAIRMRMNDQEFNKIYGGKVK